MGWLGLVIFIIGASMGALGIYLWKVLRNLDLENDTRTSNRSCVELCSTRTRRLRSGQARGGRPSPHFMCHSKIAVAPSLSRVLCETGWDERISWQPRSPPYRSKIRSDKGGATSVYPYQRLRQIYSASKSSKSISNSSRTSCSSESSGGSRYSQTRTPCWSTAIYVILSWVQLPLL